MGLFTKDKKLIDYDPMDLNLDMLSNLQASLVAKLILVNEELIQRYKNITDLSSNLSNSDDARSVLSDGAKHLEQVNAILKHELVRITDNDKQSGNTT